MTERILYSTWLSILEQEPNEWALHKERVGLPPDLTFNAYVEALRESGILDEWHRQDEEAMTARRI